MIPEGFAIALWTPSPPSYKQPNFIVRHCRGLSGRSATSIVAAYSRSFRLMRSRTQFAPLARVRSLTPAPLRARPFEGSLSLREKLFYLAFVSHFHPKGRRRFPKGDRKALGNKQNLISCKEDAPLHYLVSGTAGGFPVAPAPLRRILLEDVGTERINILSCNAHNHY